MKLGINQTLLLKRCFAKGYIEPKDVSIYYSIKFSKRNLEQLLAVIEKLKIRGLLEKGEGYKWSITEKGREVLKENIEAIGRKQ